MTIQRRPESRVLLPVLFVVAAWSTFAGCSEQGAERAAKLPENSTTQEALSAAVRTAVDQIGDNPELSSFYSSNNYGAVWVDTRGLTGRGEQAVVALKAAGARGLRTEDYAVEAGGTNSAAALAATEVAVSGSFLRFVSDLRWGRHNRGLYGEKPGPANLLAMAIAADPDGVEAGIEKLEPPFAEYKRLLAALPRYQQSGTPEEVAKIELNLERWRQLPRAFSHGPILVNVPEYMARVFDDKLQTVMSMRVIVGLPQHQTPIFNGEISYLMFGPYWNVPTSILHKEIIPDIEKDRTYLTRNSYEVQDQQGKVISNGEVSDEILAGLKSNEYKIRQVPGAKNALGRVKFMFPNDENVYLHDTNNRSLFQKTVRALSHGCVRVEKPQELAEWVLRNETAWPKDKILAALKQTKQQQANLKQHVPILIVYLTATANEAGEVTFHKDIYGRDAQ